MLRFGEAALMLAIVGAAAALLTLMVLHPIGSAALTGQVRAVGIESPSPREGVLFFAGCVTVLLLLGRLMDPERTVRVGLACLVATTAGSSLLLAHGFSDIPSNGSFSYDTANTRLFAGSALLLFAGLFSGLSMTGYGVWRRRHLPSTADPGSSMPWLPAITPTLAIVLPTWLLLFTYEDSGYVERLLLLAAGGCVTLFLLVALHTREAPVPALALILAGRRLFVAGIAAAAWYLGRIPVMAEQRGGWIRPDLLFEELLGTRRLLQLGLIAFFASLIAPLIVRWFSHPLTDTERMVTAIGQWLPPIGVTTLAGSILLGLIEPAAMMEALSVGSMAMLGTCAAAVVGPVLVAIWFRQTARG